MCYGYFFYGYLPNEEFTDVLLERILKQGDVFVDVGANIGFFTRQAARKVGQTGTVLAFEPLQRAQRLLRMNSRDLPWVQIRPLAVGELDGEVAFYENAAGDISSLGPALGGVKTRIKVTTLNTELATMRRVDFIKIDVEGFELPIIKGATQVLSVQRPFIYFEFLEQHAESYSFQEKSFETLLTAFQYKMFSVAFRDKQLTLNSCDKTSYRLAVPFEKEKIVLQKVPYDAPCVRSSNF